MPPGGCGFSPPSSPWHMRDASPDLGSERRDETLILVAEDHDDNRAIAVAILQHAGFAVIEAVNGLEALALARTQLPKLVLMDVSMPELDGWSVTRALRHDERTRDIVVIALTAHALPEDRQRAEDAGCDGFLTKPIGPAALLASVRDALRP
jgi:two-component system, cell cycle response regulator DivK